MGQEEKKPERILKTDLREYAARKRTDGPYADNLDVDVLIVGAGFGGAYALYEMRKQGYKTVLYDAGTSFGGTWRWNIYPGARVDSPVPIYELAIPEVYKDWTVWHSNMSLTQTVANDGAMTVEHELPRLGGVASVFRSRRPRSGPQQGLCFPDSRCQLRVRQGFRKVDDQDRRWKDC